MPKDSRPISDWLGKAFGLLVFLGGIALLLLVFKMAFGQFNVPPEEALKLEKGKPLDVTMAVQSFAGIFIRVLLLIVMAVIGSLVANRGIAMFTGSRALPASHLRPTSQVAPETDSD